MREGAPSNYTEWQGDPLGDGVGLQAQGHLHLRPEQTASVTRTPGGHCSSTPSNSREQHWGRESSLEPPLSPSLT